MSILETTILQEADSVVNGDRQDDYGAPEDNLANIAQGWNGYLSAVSSRPLDGRDVGNMMAILKAIRDANRPKRDNLVDGAGYFECADRCEIKR